MEAFDKLNKTANIFAIMIEDHCRIEELINNLEKNIDKGYTTVQELFNKFEWNLEKHIFIEEKAIFTSYNPDDIIDGYKMLPELTKQHNVILNQLNIIRKNIRKRREIIEIYSFKEFLLRHKNFEERNVYPNLNESLNDEQKRLIIEKINDII